MPFRSHTRYLHAGDCGFPFVSYTQRRPRLGLAARSRVATHPGVRGFYHWAGELTGRQAAQSPSRRAAERASARNSSSPCPHLPQGPFKTCPANAKAGQRRVPAFASSHRPLTHALAICSGQSHPCFCRRNRNHPGSGRRAITLTRSDHPTATGESAPSVMTPTPKSPHANAWYGDAPVRPTAS